MQPVFTIMFEVTSNQDMIKILVIAMEISTLNRILIQEAEKIEYPLCYY